MSKYIAIAALLASSLAAQDAASLIQSAEQAVRFGQYAEADVLYAKAASLGDRPDTLPALWYLGTRAAGQGNRLAAEGFFERVLRVQPNGSLAVRSLTWLGNLRQLDDPAGAEALFKKAMAMTQPGNVDGQEMGRSYGFLMRRQGRGDEADAMEQTWGRVTRFDAPKAAALPAGVYKVGGGVTPPKLLSKVEPVYTEEARSGKIQGTVVLMVDIDPQGMATNLEVLRSVEPGLDQKAMEAVRQWQFQPGTKDGAPVTVRATIEVNFRLK
jgi:TonB family protein